GQFPVPGCGVDRSDDRTSRSDPASESGSGSAGYREGPEHATEGVWKLGSSARLFRYTENGSRVGVTWRRAACARGSGLWSWREVGSDPPPHHQRSGRQVDSWRRRRSHTATCPLAAAVGYSTLAGAASSADRRPNWYRSYALAYKPLSSAS